jgi:spore maturation protein CgeE
VFEKVPHLEEITSLEVATFRGENSFCCSGSMFYFKRRKYAILGNLQENLVKPKGHEQVDFGNKFDDLSLVSSIFSMESMGSPWLLWCEQDFANCFSTMSEVQGGNRYRDELLKDMYSHNFTLFWRVHSEDELFRCINEEVAIRKEEGVDFCNIVSYLKISDKLINKFEIKPEVTVSGFYEFDRSNWSQLQGRDDCVISSVSNEEMLKDALFLDIEEDGETLGVDFCTRRIARRKDTYLADRNYISKKSPYGYYGLNCYICYHNGEPVGKCDLFIKSGRAKIEDFQVAPDKQRQGFGTALLKHVIDVAISKGVGIIYLITDEENTAKEMYLKTGFIKVGEEKHLLFKW